MWGEKAVVTKRKTEKKSAPKRVKLAFNKAIVFASGTAKSAAELGNESLEGARTAVRSRPLTTAMLTLGVGAIIGGLAALIPGSLFRDS
jgi:hypothetical protein